MTVHKGGCYMNFHYFMDPSPILGPISDRAKRHRLTRDMMIRLGKALKTEGLINPDDMVPVIAPDRFGKRKEFPMIWGYHVEGLDAPIIKARVENARDTEIFKESWQRRRCVIPAAYYFEWSCIQSGDRIIPKDKYVVQPTGEIITYFAGLYRIEEGHNGFKYPAFIMLTRPSTSDMKKVDDRMPVMLDAANIDTWIQPGEVPKIKAATEMVAEKV